ncbi:type II toxin-antitoxin system RelE/ParE family toxin [Desulfobacter sp.]|uniref:type II toxin-antitoxin system RelE/ParE family toxin n=1 Tax=Desulfobacter sp. TaxID=2294 RepID=UPI00338EC642
MDRGFESRPDFSGRKSRKSFDSLIFVYPESGRNSLSYIRKDKPSAAINFRNRAEKILRTLEDFPESGRIVTEFPELPYREVIISPYR